MKTILFPFFCLIALCGLSGCNPDPKTVGPKKSAQEISVAVLDDPQVLDPRLVRDTPSINISHMLFEGLMRKDYVGKLSYGVASSHKVSDDGTIHTFTLKKTYWSDGSPLTAYDFEYAWKSVLDPTFPAPNAYQLFCIKGAQAAKSGTGSLDEVGVKAIDEETLQVTLEQPLVHFKELLTTHFFYPVSRQWAEDTKSMRFSGQESLLTNGPFRLSSWKRNNQISFEKNPQFWDQKNVSLNGIHLIVADENTALQMYRRNQLDWVGSPMSMLPIDALKTLKAKGELVITPAAGIHLLRLNIETFPLNNLNMRKALALSIDRKSIVEHVIQSNQKPATGIVPLNFGLQMRPYFEDNNITKAWTHYQEALKELQLSKDEMPTLVLCYVPNERNHKIVQAVQRQWKDALGIDVALEACEAAVFYDRLGQENYQISIGSWYGDINDPINFLEVFKHKDASTNHTRWENADFVSLLDKAAKETDAAQRYELFVKAELKLIDEMPVIPLYYPTFNHLNRSVAGVYFSELGYLDFTYAFRDLSMDK